MTTEWLLNLAAYSLQLAALVAAAFVVASVMRLWAPGPALRFWQAILIGSLLLPFLQRTVTGSPDALTSSAIVIGRALSTSTFTFDLTRVTSMAMVALICGTAARIVWLGLGFVRLRAIHHRSSPLVPTPPFVGELTRRLNVSADIRISDDIDGPVTIGVRRPSVLLPTRALALPLSLQQAIVCHELIHVRRRDWAHTVLEELWCGLLWFHPAARLVVSRIALMREALVDRQTLAITGDRRAYAQALMTFAEPTAHVPVAVPSLIRPRHLSRRIAWLAQEVSMSRGHSAAALGIGFVIVSAATIATASRFPITSTRAQASAVKTWMAAGTQDEPFRPGKDVTLPQVIKEVKPQYTAAAMQAKIQGSVHMDVVVLANGDVGTIRIAKSLDAEYGLDDEAMRAAAQWKFAPGRRDGKPVPVLITVEMTFTLRK